TACGESARVWVCRPESIVGQKLQALWHHGLVGWRPKDLNDLRVLLERLPLDPASLREAVTALFADLGGTLGAARRLLGAWWWGLKFASARWSDYVRTPQGRDAPRELAVVVREVAGHLVPVLGDEP